RFLAGDLSLYRRLENDLLPALALREWDLIVQNLAEIARARHAKYGNTIFHLEPNLKECPGGLRDYHLAQWLALLTSLQSTKAWPRPAGPPFTEPMATANTPSISSPPPAVSFTSATTATTTPSTGTHRTTPPRTASVLKPEVPPTPPTGCAPTIARRVPSTAAPWPCSTRFRPRAAPFTSSSAASALPFPAPISSSSTTISTSPLPLKALTVTPFSASSESSPTTATSSRRKRKTASSITSPYSPCRCPRGPSYGIACAKSSSAPTPRTLCAPCTRSASSSCSSLSFTASTRSSSATPTI